MQTISNSLDYLPAVLDFSPLRLSEEQFDNLARNQPDLNIELTAEGELVILAPTTIDTGWKNSDLNFFVNQWARSIKNGKVFDSSTLFTLPNGAKRSPDVAWVSGVRWNALPEEEKGRFAHLAPDFVIELRSKSDRLYDIQDKMTEYRANGVRFGWLIDPFEKRVHIYRPNGEIEVLDDPETVSGEDVLPGFELPVREIWQVD